MEVKNIAVVGGLGRMGAWMAHLFTEAGHKVSIFDACQGPICWDQVASAEVVILAVPIPALEDVMTELGPLTREDGVVIDIASLKTEPIRIMLQHCRGEVIGSHPLFGPRTGDLDGQTFFLCQARSTLWLPWFRSFLETKGARVMDIDPQRHDRLMSRVQVLRHLFIFCFGRSLMRLEFDPAGDAALSGPLFSELLGQLDRQLAQEPNLFADLALFNPDADQVADEFMKAASEVVESFGSHDRTRIVSLIDSLSSHFQKSSPLGLNQPESDPQSCVDLAKAMEYGG